jgi:hypothetical protein
MGMALKPMPFTCLLPYKRIEEYFTDQLGVLLSSARLVSVIMTVLLICLLTLLQFTQN